MILWFSRPGTGSTGPKPKRMKKAPKKKKWAKKKKRR
jgi:hypothetical protein